MRICTRMNIKVEKNIPLISFGINLILFLLVIFTLKPLINTWDDAVIMYSFSGSFDTSPTELVDYSWGWHFILGLLVKNLFILIPNLNWYTLLLLILNWVSSSLILIYFLNSYRILNACLYFAIFFLVFETTLILSLNFTSTSIILAIASNILLIENFYRSNSRKTTLIIPFTLLIISGLLRFHTWVLVEIILGISVFYFQRKKVGHYIALKFVLLILIGLFFIAHQYYYKSKIPGWEQKEKISQILFSHYNAPKIEKQNREIFKDSIEYDFFYNSFFYDNQIFSGTRLKEITTSLTRARKISNPEDIKTLYWVFINGRLYFLTLAIPLFFLIAERKWYLLKRILPFLILSFILYCYLFFFWKVTESIFLGLIITNWLVIFVFSTKEKIIISRLSRLIFTPLIFFCMLWGFTRVYKIHIGNIEKYNKWICYYTDLKRNRSFIHVSITSESPIDYISILDNPIDFPIPNFISLLHFNVTVYEKKKEQLGLKNVTEDLLSRSDLVLTGPEIFSLKSYYLKKYQKNVELVTDSIQYKCANVYRIVLK